MQRKQRVCPRYAKFADLHNIVITITHFNTHFMIHAYSFILNTFAAIIQCFYYYNICTI